LVLFGNHDNTSYRTLDYAALVNKNNVGTIPALRVGFNSSGDLWLHVNSSSTGSGWHNIVKFAVQASANSVWYAADASAGTVTAPSGMTWTNVTA
jgi:hypothetical protein